MRGWVAAIVAVVMMLWVATATLAVSLAPIPDDEGAARFVPVDGQVERIAHGPEQLPATVDSARVRGAAALSAGPRPALQAARPPRDSNPRTTELWRESVRPAGHGAGGYRMHALTPAGLTLMMSVGAEAGVALDGGLVELPADIGPDRTWSSRAPALVGPTTVEATNRSRAVVSADAQWRDRGCLDVTAETTLGTTIRTDVATWCPGRGVVAGTPMLGEPRTQWTGDWPAPARAVEATRTVPQAPSIVRPNTLSGEPVFGWREIDQRNLPVSTAGVLLPDGTIVQADTTSGALVGWRPDRRPGAAPALRTAWWAQPEGLVTHLEAVGDVVIAMTSTKRMAAYDSSGRRLWRGQLPDLAPGGPAQLGEDGLVVVTLSGQVLAYALADGRELWRAQVKGGSSSAPVVRGARVLIVTTEDGIAVLDASGKPVFDQEDAPPLGALLADGTPMTLHVGGQLFRWDARTGDLDAQGLVAVGRGSRRLLVGHGYVAAYGGGTLTMVDPRAMSEVSSLAGALDVQPTGTGWLAVTGSELVDLAPNGDVRARIPLGVAVDEARIAFDRDGVTVLASPVGGSGSVVVWVR